MSDDYQRCLKRTYPAYARYAFYAFLLLFLLTGTLGHDPWWKRGEAYGFGIIHHFYFAHTWLVPVDAGAPFLEKPPLYYWTAVVFCDLFAGFLPMHDAARLASSFYTLVTLIFTYKTGLQFFRQRPDGKTLAGINLALLLGTHGILEFTHCLLTDNALLAGTAIAVYGFGILATEQEKWKKGGIWAGIGIGVAFMSKGFIMPGILAVSGVAMLAVMPALRTRETFKAITLAILAASPFLLLWPALLYADSPALFHEWFWDNNIGRFFGFSVAHYGAENDREHFITLLLTVAFPTLPLALFETWRSRKNWRDPHYALPLMLSVTGTLVLFVSASCRAPYLMPLIPAYSLLATQAVTSFPRNLRSIVNGTLIIAFSLALIVIWLCWWSVSQAPSTRHLAWLPHYFHKWISINYIVPGSQPLAIATASAATSLWALFIYYKKQCKWNVALVWLVGSMTVWTATYSILLPWINETKSFRTILSRFESYIEASPYKNSCVGNYHMGENIPPMLTYFTGKTTDMPLMEYNEHTCPVLLQFAEQNSSPDVDKDWRLIWKDSGFTDVKGMELRLYERK